MPLLSEIRAPERVVPRYEPGRRLPAYRYVPGAYPHPVRDPAGHSYEPQPEAVPRTEWEPADWNALSDWLWGVDLFNAFYFWEAHEVWERLWAAKSKNRVPALMLQGLIQVAAALLKIHMGSIDAATKLSRAGLDKLARAATVAPILLGLDLDRTVASFRNYFRPLLVRTLPPLDASVPLLLLSRDSAREVA